MPDEATQADDFLGIAEEHATAGVPTASPEQPAAAVLGDLTGRSFAYADEIAVLDGERLVGLLSIERLLAAPGDAPVSELMDPDPPVVKPHTDQAAVARRMIDHGESGIAVVNGAGKFVGMIPAHLMLDVLLLEHEKDLARISGYLAGTRQARGAAEEPVIRRLWHRLPWLLIGLAGAMLSAGLMSAYERQLDEIVLLALFVPAVVYLAAAVGMQTEMVLIRGLSAGVPIRGVVGRELISGLLLGLLLGAALFVFTLIAWGDAELALAVALALIAGCACASVVAMLLPWAFQRFGSDPAFGSGPLATVLQDLISIAVYLAIATAIVT